jgi:hypothetical protein
VLRERVDEVVQAVGALVNLRLSRCTEPATAGTDRPHDLYQVAIPLPYEPVRGLSISGDAVEEDGTTQAQDVDGLDTVSRLSDRRVGWPEPEGVAPLDVPFSGKRWAGSGPRRNDGPP